MSVVGYDPALTIDDVVFYLNIDVLNVECANPGISFAYGAER